MEPRIDRTIAVEDSAGQQDVNRQKKSEPRPLRFWMSFGLAMGLYALVMLSPKLAERERLLSELQNLHSQVEEDESRISRLKVANISLRRLQSASLTNEKTSEEAAVDQAEDGREILPITPSETGLITSDKREHNSNEPDRASDKLTHWYAPVVVFLGDHARLRGALLLGVVVLILSSFSSAPVATSSNQDQEFTPEEVSLHSHTKEGFLSRFLSRYQAKEDVDLEELEQRLLALAAEEDEWQSDALPIDVDNDESENASDKESSRESESRHG